MLNVKVLLTKILNGIVDPTNRFDISAHTVEVGSVAANSYVADQTQTFTKAGYFPCGIVGYNCNNTWGCVLQLDTSVRTTGSVTIRYSLRNLSSSSISPRIYTRVFWLKLGGVVKHLKNAVTLGRVVVAC